MRALDLFCGAGGASLGLFRAGFCVEGVDINPQPNYVQGPLNFAQANALEYLQRGLHHFDLIWASPPCQAFTAYKRRTDHVRPALNLIPITRARLQESGVPHIIENVTGARDQLVNPVMLCGSMFGLDVQRHRLFECSFPVRQPKCRHDIWTPRFPQATNRKNKRKTVEVGVWRIPLEVQQRAMGIDWMTLEELSQAIPPAYSEYLANEFLLWRARECEASEDGQVWRSVPSSGPAV